MLWMVLPKLTDVRSTFGVQSKRTKVGYPVFVLRR